MHVYSLLIGGYFKSYKSSFIKLVLQFVPVPEEHGMKTLEFTCIFNLFTNVHLHALPAFIPKEES